MKKSALILAILLLIAIAGCGGEEPEASPSPSIKPVITIPSPSPSPSPVVSEAPKQYTGKVSNSDNGVNIRSEPALDAGILRTADTGEIFTVLETGIWCKVQLEDGVGYIHSDYLEITEVR